jgi:hypothetical protein
MRHHLREGAAPPKFENQIDADPSRILFSIRISTAGTDLMPPFGAQSTGGNARYHTSGNAGGLEALLGDKGMIPTASTRYEKTARNFPWRDASGLRTRLAQMTRGPRIANPSKGSGGSGVQMNFDAPAALCPTERSLGRTVFGWFKSEQRERRRKVTLDRKHLEARSRRFLKIF